MKVSTRTAPEWTKSIWRHALPYVFPWRVRAARKFLETGVLTMEETMQKVIRERMSLARFGDGELVLLTGRDLTFQRSDERLVLKLQALLASPPANCLVALPPSLPNDSFWASFWARRWRQLSGVFTPTPRVFGNSMVSRPEMFNDTSGKGLELWRELLVGRSVAVVTGQGSRFLADSDIFGEDVDMRFIWAPAQNAFDSYDQILSETTELDTDLTLIALGPTGTVLAADLAAEGIWAVDCGHLPNSYRYALGTAPMPELQ